MTVLSIAIGADHRGWHHKEFLKRQLHNLLQDTPFRGVQLQWHDVGTDSSERCDFPQFAYAVAECIMNGTAQWGILLCGTGIGMSIAANRFSAVNAGIAWNNEIARRSREEDGLNVLVLPADYISAEEAGSLCVTWLCATPRNDVYAHRRSQLRAFGTHSL